MQPKDKIPYTLIQEGENKTHCWLFNKTQHTAQVSDKINVQEKIFSGTYKPWEGIRIRPLQPSEVNTDGFIVKKVDTDQRVDNECYFIFMSTETIDMMIGELQACKKRLASGITLYERRQREEEYRRKYYGQRIEFSDLVALRKEKARA